MEKIEKVFEKFLDTPMTDEEDDLQRRDPNGELLVIFRAGALHRQRELIEELREQFGKMYDSNENGVEYMQTFPINQILDEVMNILTTIEKEVE